MSDAKFPRLCAGCTNSLASWADVGAMSHEADYCWDCLDDGRFLFRPVPQYPRTERQEKKNMKAIVTTYLGPTERRGPRIVATDSDNNRVTIPYPHDLSESQKHAHAARALCRKMGWSGTLAEGSLRPGSSVFVWIGDMPRQNALDNIFVVRKEPSK